jgi:hypothetical protein
MAREIDLLPSDEEEGLPPPNPRAARSTVDLNTVAPSGKDNKKERREAMAAADAEAADRNAFSIVMGACLPECAEEDKGAGGNIKDASPLREIDSILLRVFLLSF